MSLYSVQKLLLVRAWIVVSAATEGARGETLCFEPIPAFAITGCIATLQV